MNWNLTGGFLRQVRWENLNLLRMRSCFAQPFCYCQVIDNFFILLILFILPQKAEYMEWHKLPC